MNFHTLISLAFIATTAAAAADTPNNILTSWRAWAEKHNITKTAIAVGLNTDIVAKDGLGRDPMTAYPVASLTKAITAVCLKDVMQDAGLQMTATLGDLQPEFSKVNVAIPAKLHARTLAQVITMTSGQKPDRTQGQFNSSYRYRDTRNIGFSKRALHSSGLKGQPDEFFYNNGNYALLGALIEALTGTDNVTACRDHVFPEGHRDTAAFNSDWIALAGFGGWEASVVDYTAFAMQAFHRDSDISKNLTALPNYQSSAGWGYGLGTFFRRNYPRNIYWHNGALCGVKGGDQGAYFASYPNGYVVTVTYNACGVGPAANDLDALLFGAATN